MQRVATAATWVVVGVGVALRVWQWRSGRDFWLDELLLLRSMRAQSIGALLEPLPYDQSAPPGWLAVQHAVLGLSDADERAMRLLPLLFGCGGLVLTALLARTLLGPVAALAAVALCAWSTRLAAYSDEFKQYSADVFWVPLILLLGCRVALGRGQPRRAVPALAAAAAVGVWFSHPAGLVTVGVFVALGLLALAGRRWRELALLVAASVPAGIGLVAQYLLVLRENVANEVLRPYWAGAFPARPLTAAGVLDWFGDRATALTENPLGYAAHPWLLLTLLLAGLVTLGARQPAGLLVLLLPVAVVTAAGLAGAYPVADRVALFLVPMTALVLAAPIDLLGPARSIGRPRLRAAALVGAGAATAATVAGLAVLSTPQIRDAVRQVGQPHEEEEASGVLAYVAAHRADGDLVLVDGRGARFAAAFYGPRTRLGPYRVLELSDPDAACAGGWLGAELRRGDRPRRVWLVLSHTRSIDAQAYREHLARFGTPVDEVAAPGAQAVRYDRSAAPPAATPPALRCVRLTEPTDRD